MTAAVHPRLKRATLRERVRLLEFASAPRVDRDKGVIYGVKVLGPVSENRRRYTPEAVEGALHLYEGRAVNADHPARPTDTRSVRDTFAWLENVRVEGGEVRADLHLLDPADPLAVKLLNAAEQNPGLFGLSHNAEGEGHTDAEGVFVVERITEVRSVDLVTDPATTRGLFEGRRMAITYRNLFESLASKPKVPARVRRGLRSLCEAADEEHVLDEMCEDGAGAGGMDGPMPGDGDDWKDHIHHAMRKLNETGEGEHWEMADKLHKLLKPKEGKVEEGEGEEAESEKEKNENKPPRKGEEAGASADDLEEGEEEEEDGGKMESRRRSGRKPTPAVRKVQEELAEFKAKLALAEARAWVESECRKRKLDCDADLLEMVLPLGDRRKIGAKLDWLKKIRGEAGRQYPRSQAAGTHALTESAGYPDDDEKCVELLRRRSAVNF